MKPSRLDLVIIIVILLSAGAISLWAKVMMRPGELVEIYQNNRELDVLDLNQDQTFNIPGVNGPMIIEIKERQVAVIEVHCPGRTCVKMGPIHRSGEALICVPNGVVIKIGGKSNSDLDATTQ